MHSSLAVRSTTRRRRVQVLAGAAALLFLAAVLIINGGQKAPDDRAMTAIPDGCTVIMVGKNASADGSVMSTHAADCGMCDFTWRHVPAADHKPGDKRRIYHIDQIKSWPPSEGLKWDLVKKEFTGLELPEPAHTYGYNHNIFGYMNDQQLAMAESTIGCVRKIANQTPTPHMTLTMLTLLAMERCVTAREAIQLMGSLAEKYGYGYYDGGEMLAVSDPNEIWIFEIMPVGPLWTPESGKPGAVWCAQRIPDDEVSVCPNESRIGVIDLENKDYFMASPNVVSFAVETGLYDPKSGQPFSWKKAYSPTSASAVSSEGRQSRMWRFFDLVAPSRKFNAALPNMDFPFSVKPDKKLSVQDVMALARDKSEGTVYDPVRGIRGGPFQNPNYYKGTRLISVPNVEYTTLTQCRAGMPDAIGGILWISLGSLDTSCFMPFYAGVTAIPESFTIGDHFVLNRKSARWAFDYVDFHTQAVYNSAILDVRKVREKWEGEAVLRTAEIDRKALDLYKKKPADAVRFLTGYCLSNADSVVDAWWKLGDDLLVKYNHLMNYDAAARKIDRRAAGDAPWWKKAVKAMDIMSAEEPQK